MGALYLAYLICTFFGGNKRKRRLSLSSDCDDDDARREFNERFDSNIIWTVLRPLVTQVLVSALEDRVTQNSFRNLCISVLADDKMKAQFRAVVADVWHANEVQESLTGCLVRIVSDDKVGHALAMLFKNACSDDQAATGLARVLTKAVGSVSKPVLTETLSRLPSSSKASQVDEPDHVASLPTVAEVALM